MPDLKLRVSQRMSLLAHVLVSTTSSDDLAALRATQWRQTQFGNAAAVLSVDVRFGRARASRSASFAVSVFVDDVFNGLMVYRMGRRSLMVILVGSGARVRFGDLCVGALDENINQLSGII